MKHLNSTLHAKVLQSHILTLCDCDWWFLVVFRTVKCIQNGTAVGGHFIQLPYCTELQRGGCVSSDVPQGFRHAAAQIKGAMCCIKGHPGSWWNFEPRFLIQTYSDKLH